MNPIRFLLIAAAGLCASCSNQQDTSTAARQAAYKAYDLPASLPSNPANVRVKVSLEKGLTYVMEGDRPLLIMPVGVGAAATPTPAGNFQIFNKQHYRRANTHGFALKGDQIRRTYLRDRKPGESFKGTPMPYWSEFRSAYGFHTGWIRPHPHTNGCLRMHQNVAPKFFRLVQNGTPVHIARTQPEDETIGKNIDFPPTAAGLEDFPAPYYLTDQYFTEHKTPNYQ